MLEASALSASSGKESTHGRKEQELWWDLDTPDGLIVSGSNLDILLFKSIKIQRAIS